MFLKFHWHSKNLHYINKIYNKIRNLTIRFQVVKYLTFLNYMTYFKNQEKELFYNITILKSLKKILNQFLNPIYNKLK
jgi:hypothetical protein